MYLFALIICPKCVLSKLIQVAFDVLVVAFLACYVGLPELRN